MWRDILVFPNGQAYQKEVMLLIFERNKEVLKFPFWVNEVFDTTSVIL